MKQGGKLTHASAEFEAHPKSELARLPIRVGDGLVLLDFDRPHAVHAAHVMQGPPQLW